MDLRKSLSDWHSRWFGTWSLDDPRPTQAGAPYTFYLPSQPLLDAVQRGDLVKAIFRPSPPNRKFRAERMWVIVHDRSDNEITGTLDNDPSDMPQLKPGTIVTVPLTHVIDIQWADGHDGPVEPPSREYWERCIVDDCVIEGRSHVDYLYREEQAPADDGDIYPDSGWRFRGTDEGIAADDAAGRKPVYIAIGKVLNEDDRWIHLIDESVGSAFQWNETSGLYEPA